MTTQQEQKWTKEPWPDDGTSQRGDLLQVVSGSKNGVFEGLFNRRRAVSCVNKLAGQPDLEQVEICPKGTLDALRDAVKRQGFTNANLIEARSILARADKQNNFHGKK